jgi:hypothetical protein
MGLDADFLFCNENAEGVPNDWGKTSSYFATSLRKIKTLDLPTERERIEAARKEFRRLALSPSYLLGASIVQTLALPKRAHRIISRTRK